MVISKKLHLQYNGAKYYGWQVQKGLPTIQGELNCILAKLFNNSEISSIGSGRTDRGVHANMQIVKVDLSKDFENLSLQKALNSLLPIDIRVINIEDCSRNFHPVRDAVSKEYCYYFSAQKSPFYYDLVTYYPYEIDIKLLQRGVDLFTGTHDFKNFYCTGTDISTTTRTIYKASVQERLIENGFGSPISVTCISLCGNGFLKQMVRQIVGALWKFSTGVVSEQELIDAINCKTENRVGDTAPPNGLYLNSVTY